MSTQALQRNLPYSFIPPEQVPDDVCPICQDSLQNKEASARSSP